MFLFHDESPFAAIAGRMCLIGTWLSTGAFGALVVELRPLPGREGRDRTTGCQLLKGIFP